MKPLKYLQTNDLLQLDYKSSDPVFVKKITYINWIWHEITHKS